MPKQRIEPMPRSAAMFIVQSNTPRGPRGRCDPGRAVLASVGVNEVQVGLAIRAIQADNQVIRMWCVHSLCVCHLAFPQA